MLKLKFQTFKVWLLQDKIFLQKQLDFHKANLQ